VFTVAGRFITGRFNTVVSSRGRFITRSIQHRSIHHKKLLYAAVIVFKVSFSKVCDTWWWLLSGKCLCDCYQENVQAKV